MTTEATASPSPMDLLPVESIQDIIRCLPQNDQLTFSLLSKRLRAIRLHVALQTINMNGWKAVYDWDRLLDYFKEVVKGCCRSLSCTIDNIGSSDPRKSGDYYANFFTQHLNGFGELTSLHLIAVHLDAHQLILIKDSQPHITELTLNNCLSTLDGFAMLINNFPKLTHLTLINIGHHSIPDEKLPPHLPAQSPRKLIIADFNRGSVPILNWIFSEPWDGVSVLEGKNTPRMATQHFIESASANVRDLDLQENLLSRGKSTLGDCKKLRELKIRWGIGEVQLISTIQSMEIKKIIITRSDASSVLSTGPYLEQLDEALTGLLKRLGHGRSLEVEIQVVRFFPEDYKATLGEEGDYLPNFRGRGGLVNFLDPK